MSRAAFAHDTDTAQASKSRASGLRVNKPGDSYEVEADRVAETVASGGKIGNLASNAWSFSRIGTGQIQRDDKEVLTPEDEEARKKQAALDKINHDLANKKTPDPADAAKNNPIVKAAEAVVGSTPGKVAVGTAAATAVGVLASEHRPLPAQPPAIPLGKSGFSLKPSVQGPLNRPTGAGLTFGFSPTKSSAEEKQARERTARDERENRAWEARELRDFQDGLKTPEQRQQEEEDASYRINAWVLGQQQGTGRVDINKYAPPALGAPVGPQLTVPPVRSLGMRTPTLLDKKLELKPLTGPTADKPAADAADEKKKEEIPVQRKAMPSTEMYADSGEVESVVRSSGRPLGAETRRTMESRIGFDFSKVRVHDDARAAASARSLGAHAYTVGNAVVFGQGRFAPQTNEGRRLLAHELTHVVQQTSPVHRPHPVVRPAPRQVQRFWGIELPDAKNWLLGKLRDLKGYSLFCVVIGQDLITGQQVERNATNLTEGVLKLFDDGPALFEKLKKVASAIDTAYHWVLAQIAELGLTEDYFSKLLDRALGAVELTHPIDSWNRVTEILKEPLDKLIELASRMAKAVLNFILEAALSVFGDTGKRIYAFFKKAGNVLGKIAADPLKFAKNLFDAIQLGFKNFGSRILEHLGEGVKTWIFEELNIKGVTIPKEFTFGSILKLILQVLGLTYEQRRPQLVEKLTEPVVYFFETSAKVLDKIRKEGFSAIWALIKEQAESIFNSLIGSLKEWIAKEIVGRALVMVASLANPVGELVEAVRSIYETVEFIIEKASKLADLIETVLNALSDIVDGTIAPAAQKVEDSLAKTIPLILRFLAGLLHLSGIGKSIREIIDKVRKPIDDVIGLVLDKIVATAKPLWEKGKEAFLGQLGKIKEWWKKPQKFKYGEENHEVGVEGEGDHPQVFVQSTKTPLEHFLNDVKATPKQKKSILKLASQLNWRKGELQKPEDDAKGSKIYDKLRDELDNLKAREAPKSQIRYPQAPHALGGGQEADAFLSSNREPGTEPNDTDPPIWTDLGDEYRKKKSYVRGHLLSMRLGGLGLWKNLMPITNTVNQRMNAQVESKLKKSTGSGNRYYHYNVKAQYGDTVLPPAEDKPKAAEKKARGLAAEQRLISLSWTVKPAQYDPDAGGWKETEGELLDSDGKAMDARVAQGDFTPPTVT